MVSESIWHSKQWKQNCRCEKIIGMLVSSGVFCLMEWLLIFTPAFIDFQRNFTMFHVKNNSPFCEGQNNEL